MANTHRTPPGPSKRKNRVVWVQASLYSLLKEMIECGPMKEEDRMLCLYVDEPGLLTLMEFLPPDTLADALPRK
jgi:hypothetical protein